MLRFIADPVDGYGESVGMAAQPRFVASIREGAAPLFTAHHSLRELEVLDAAQQSGRTGRPVAVAHER